jgi:hypothetical protein
LLLRDSVRRQARRVVIERADLSDATKPAEAEIATRRLIRAATPDPQGWGDRFVVAPLAYVGVTALRHALPQLARLGGLAAALLAIGAVLSVWFDRDMLGFLAALLSLVVANGTARAVAITHIPARGARLADAIPVAGAALATIGAALLPWLDRSALVLAAVLVAQMVLIARLGHRSDVPWLADVPGALVVLPIGAAFGTVGLSAALALCVVHAFVSLGWLQNKLSRALTLTR